VTDFGKRPGDMFKSTYDPDEDGVIAVAQTEALCFYERGNLSAWDWQKSDFSLDMMWHDLDCSAIVPEGTALIQFVSHLQGGSLGRHFFLRKKGYANEHNKAATYCQASDYYIDQQWLIPCDENRKVQYYGSSGAISYIHLAIVGWMK